MNHHTHSRGFTLIELLVVISIIGLLSSVVLASLRTARDKGEVAAGLKFGGYNFRTLNANSVVSYNFDETGANVTDLSGNGYNLTLNGCGAPLYCRSSLSPTNTGKSLALNGSSEYARVNGGISLSGMTGATISAWIYPTAVDAVNGEPIAMFGTNPSGPVFTFGISNNSFLVAGTSLYAFSSIPQTDLLAAAFPSPTTSASPVKISLNKWQHVTAVFVEALRIRLYVNGRFAAEIASTDTFPQTASGFNLGFDTHTNAYFNGNIDDFAMYKQSLTASEVFNIYAQGLAEHSTAQK